MIFDIIFMLYGIITLYLVFRVYMIEVELNLEKEKARRMERLVFAYKDKISMLIEYMKEDSNGTR